jgi:hypothetical protein
MAVLDPRSSRSKSLIAMLLISVAGVTLLVAAAHAEDCLAAPNSPAREGARWYYRLDRATQHKCWYMRATDEPAQQAPAPTETALPAPRFAIPVPRPRPSAANAASSLSYTDRSSSHAQGIAPKLGATAPVDRSTTETTSSIPKESSKQQAGISLAPPAPSATSLIGAAKDETTSAISEMHQVAPSLETNAAATAAAPHAQTPVGATAEETDSPTSDMAASQQGTTPSQPNAQARASESNAEPQIIAPLDDAVSSIPKDSITQQSASSDFRSNDAEAVPDVSLAERQAPPEVATPDARPIPPGSALTDELVDNARMWVKPRYLIGAFVLALIGMSYYVIFRIFSWGSLYMSHGHPDDDGIEELDNKLEFYRKLHQGAALENPETI